ncbi:hypothetical protein BGX28_002212 [Mortierella sp. GBA30]|nr:hypothetical protein BGX28_002212 [Mortierella sp. GBA30]
MASILKPAYAFYSRHYRTHPVLTISTTNAFLAGISDTLTQKYIAPSPHPTTDTTDLPQRVIDMVKEDAKELAEDIKQTVHARDYNPTINDTNALTPSSSPPLDLARMGRFMLYNFSVAPVIHTWYSFLDRNFPLQSISNPAVNSTQRSRFMRTMKPAVKRMMADQALRFDELEPDIATFLD